MIINDDMFRPAAPRVTLVPSQCCIRFNPSGNNGKDEQRLAKWGTALHGWRQQGLREVYFIINTSPGQQVHLLNYMQELMTAETAI